MTRKIVQIASAGVANNATTQCNYFLFALCDDGTILRSDDQHKGWAEITPSQTPSGTAAPGLPEAMRKQLAETLVQAHDYLMGTTPADSFTPEEAAEDTLDKVREALRLVERPTDPEAVEIAGRLPTEKRIDEWRMGIFAMGNLDHRSAFAAAAAYVRRKAAP